MLNVTLKHCNNDGHTVYIRKRNVYTTIITVLGFLLVCMYDIIALLLLFYRINYCWVKLKGDIWRHSTWWQCACIQRQQQQDRLHQLNSTSSCLCTESSSSDTEALTRWEQRDRELSCSSQWCAEEVDRCWESTSTGALSCWPKTCTGGLWGWRSSAG